jgi:hypothetical protein
MATRPGKILDKFQMLIINRYSEPTIYADAKIFKPFHKVCDIFRTTMAIIEELNKTGGLQVGY